MVRHKHRNRLLGLTMCALLLLAGFGSIQPSSADGGGTDLGKYRQFGLSHNLEDQHVSWQGENLTVEGPTFTSELHVNESFLDRELGAWSADEAFSPGDGEAIFEDRNAIFRPLQLDAGPVFTWGDNSSIQFKDRPMWLSVNQADYGSNITLEMDDGEFTGQQISISKLWLMDRGLPQVRAIHEDGTELNVNVTGDQEEILIDVPHFSSVVLTSEVDVRGRIGGVTLEHDGEKRWFENQSKLEIDVGDFLGTYELLVERNWLTLNIPCVDIDYPSTNVTLDGKDFYSIPLAASETPTTVGLTSHKSGIITDPDPPHRVTSVEPGSNALDWSAGGLPPGNWSVYLEKTRYRCELGAEVPHCQNLQDTVCNDVDLVPGQTYYWQVKDNSQSPPLLGPVWTFRTEPNYGPLWPTPLSPINDAIVTGPSVELNWTGGHTHGESVNYTVLLDSWNQDPEKQYPGCIDITETTCLLSGLDGGTRYSWRIVVNDPYTTRASTNMSLLTQGTPPLHADLIPMDSIEPRHNATAPLDVQLSWSSTNESALFDVYLETLTGTLDEDSEADYYWNGTLPTLSKQVCAAVATECAPSGLQAGTEYRWTVVPNGTSPEGYPEFRFHVLPVSFESFRLVAPLNGLVEQMPFAYLYWDGPTSHDLLYHVYIMVADGEWELECVTRALHCAPRDLELGQVVRWRVDAHHNETGIVVSEEYIFGVTTGAANVPVKTMLFFGGWRQKGYNKWIDIRNLLIGDGGLPRAYDHVYGVGFYGNECGDDARAVVYGRGWGAGIDGHKDVKHWRHQEKSHSCGERLHWTKTHVEHLAYHVAWYIDIVHTSEDLVVDIAAHSMGGMIIRYLLAILEMDSSEYENDYDRQEFPKYCGGWLEPSCRNDNDSDRNYWPEDVAIKDVVTWGTAHKTGFGGGDCWLSALQTCQILRSGSSRFIDWLDDHAQGPNSQSALVGENTFWTLVGTKLNWAITCDNIAPLVRAHGMDGWWAKFRYQVPCYAHSDIPFRTTYYEDGSIASDGEGVVWVAGDSGAQVNREALVNDALGIDGSGQNTSDALPRTGHWLWYLGTSTWGDLPDEGTVVW